ncbi:MAG: tetratricopeptide repeat protein [Chloroflexi bacterium]|nr:tetratricopeptide repeat protein [Chloroflexota bacterium]
MPAPLAEKIGAAAVEVLGERREVMVVSVDTTSFTVAALTLDSEEIHLLVDEGMRLLAELVYKYEGVLDKFTGNRLMALFGALVVHENDPERAVRAALGMQAMFQSMQERVRQEHGFDFQVRIGVNMGLLIADRVGSDLRVEYSVIGDTVDLAVHLEQAAEPGAILVSHETYQRTRSLFRYEAGPPLTVRGLPHLIQTYRPLGLCKKPGLGRGLPGLDVPMVGRRDAVAQLQNALAEVLQHRHSQIVLIAGEAGLGKSRLVTEFRKSLAQLDVSVCEGSCLAYARSTPLWVVADLLRDVLHLQEADPVDVQRETLQFYLDRLGLASDKVLPYLVRLLGLEQAYPEVAARWRLLDAAMLQQQTHAALRHVFLAEARLTPTILIFEDLHWVDPASRDFVEYLIQTTSDAPLMLVLVSRDFGPDAAAHSLLVIDQGEGDQLVHVQLQVLSEEEGRLLVDQLLKRATEEARALGARVAARAEGNPFYAEEIVRMLIDEGGLTREAGIWHTTSRSDDLLQKLPGTLKGLILARFDRLPEGLRQTLHEAAVLGRSFPVSLLQMVSDASPETIIERLKELETRQFLIAEPFGLEQGYAFRHALIQEAVYDTLLKRDRRKIHERAARAIEGGVFWPPEKQTEALAYHYAESTNPSRAVPYLVVAAENAAQRYANETAIQHYRQAMTLMECQPASDESFRVPTGLGQVLKSVRVRIRLGQALKFVGEFGKASQVLEEALQYLQSSVAQPDFLLPLSTEGLRELADVRQREGALDEAIIYLDVALKALEEASVQEYATLWRSVMDRMAWVRFRQGNLEESFALASSATRGVDPERADDPITLANLYNTLGGISWQQGNLSEAIAYVEHSLNLYKGLGYTWGVANAYSNLGILRYRLGNWSVAVQNFERASTLREEIGDIQNRADSLTNLGILHLSMGKHEAGQQDLEASLAIRQRLGDSWGAALSYTSLAQLAVIQSRLEDARAYAEAALELADTVGSQDIQVQASWILALVEAESGELQAGLNTAEQALQTAKEAGLSEEQIFCLRALGVLRTRAERWEEAEAPLREALALCLEQSDPYQEGLTLLELGRLYHSRAQTGEPVEADWQPRAMAALREAAERFKALGAAYDLQMAQAALHELQADSEPTLRESE